MYELFILLEVRIHIYCIIKVQTMKIVKNTEKINENLGKVSDEQAQEAFKTIIKWIGEDPNREGLIETPKRVVKAFKE